VSRQAEKLSLLYVSPVVPSVGENGLAMRAGMVLEALSHVYRVSLLVIPRYPPFKSPIPEFFRGLCERSACAAPAEASTVFGGFQFDVVHVFRLSALPFARAYFRERTSGIRCLDLDDIESRTYRRIAALYRANGDAGLGDAAEAEAHRYALLEGLAFRMMERVYVCSRSDQQLLLNRCKASVVVLPNAVRPPKVVAARGSGIFRFLFLGTLGYYPNHDAVLWFCSVILPLLSRGTPVPFEVAIAGRGGSEQLKTAVSASGARFVGEVDDVQPWYHAAHAVIAPVRAGGGSRIKILEAFSYQRPVITTPAGIEGIEASAGEQVLVKESPEAFAAGCIQLMTDWELGERLARNARALWSRAYSSEALQKTVTSLAELPTRPESPSGGTPSAAT
jgi:polysaccharide biosynthesis protein PslH